MEAVAGWHKRLITEGERSTLAWRGRPTVSPKAPWQEAANNTALARTALSGFPCAVTSLAKVAPAPDTVRG
jgi:hypothetical protein